MINRTLKQITGIKELLNFKSEKESINYLTTKLNFKINKYINPNIINVLNANNICCKLDFQKKTIIMNKKYHKPISFQLINEILIQNYIGKYFYKNNKKLFNWFFSIDEKYGFLSKNIEIEVWERKYFSGESNHRVDIKFVLPNKFEIIIEINEIAHEKEEKRIVDLTRARKICDNNKKILKFYFLREKFINKKKDIKKFVNNVLVPFIEEIMYIEDEQQYMINELVKLTHEEWKPICQDMYFMFKNQKNAIYSINRELEFFEINNNNQKIIKQDFLLLIDKIVQQTNPIAARLLHNLKIK